MVGAQPKVIYITDEMSTNRFMYVQKIFDAVNEECNFQCINDGFKKCCDKVCELTIARACCRPLKDNEPRKSALDKSWKIVQALGGEVPTALQTVADSVVLEVKKA